LCPEYREEGQPVDAHMTLGTAIARLEALDAGVS
jgi:hypothetical protein